MNIYKLSIKKNNCYYLQYLISFIIVLLIIKFTTLLIYNSKIKQNLFNQSIISIENNNRSYNIKNETISIAAYKAKNFINIAYNGILFFNQTIIIKNNIKISCVIPIYNSENTIKQAVRSIQNQNMKEIEIILVNDFSIDNTTNILEELSKEDSRIKIINNKKNMGTLYTRCVGSLAAKGKYIIPLDSDEMILNFDVFDDIYNQSYENYYDIILFKTIIVENINDFFNTKNLMNHRGHKQVLILNQPEIGIHGFKSGVIWGKCIKNELYKKAVNSYGDYRYSFHIIFGEDTIINFIIHQYAKNSIFILNYGILNIRRKNSVCKITNRKERALFSLKYIEVIFEFSPNLIYFNKILVNKIITLLKKNILHKLLKNDRIKKYFNSLINKIIKSKKISLQYKRIIKKELLKFK